MSYHKFKTQCPVCGEEGSVIVLGGTSGTEQFEQSRRFNKLCFEIDSAAYVHILEGDGV